MFLLFALMDIPIIDSAASLSGCLHLSKGTKRSKSVFWVRGIKPPWKASSLPPNLKKGNSSDVLSLLNVLSNVQCTRFQEKTLIRA